MNCAKSLTSKLTLTIFSYGLKRKSSPQEKTSVIKAENRGQRAILSNIRKNCSLTPINSYVELIIEPANNSLNKLPFLVQRGSDEKPLKITIFKVKEAAKLLLGAKMAEKIIKGKHPSISGEANIIIYNFGAGYECDQAVFIAKLKTVNNHFSSAKVGGVNAYSGC